MKKNQVLHTGLWPGQALVIDDQHVTGPFTDAAAAVTWIENHRVVGEAKVVVLHGYAGEGTHEHAHHCGQVVK